MKSYIAIDGSYGEGGGQIVRIALFLSLLSGRPVRIYNIRKGRAEPGLKPQHLNIIKALLTITESKAYGAKLKSKELLFEPGKIKGGNLQIDFKTAGSITLFLQTILPVSLLAEKGVELIVKGGTDVPMAMTFDYFKNILLPYYEGLSQTLNLKCIKRGYYPAGNGIVKLSVSPFKGKKPVPPPIFIEKKGKPEKIHIFLSSSEKLKSRNVLERMEKILLPELKNLCKNLEIHKTYQPSLTPGCAVLLKASFENYVAGVDQLCKPGVPSEKIAMQAFKKFKKFLLTEDPLDQNLQDNIVIPLLLRSGRVKILFPTLHTRTVIWTVRQFFESSLVYNENFLISSKSLI